jgi:thiamine biosynthesis protein ThiI
VKDKVIIIRYGEIALKGKEIRRRFENKLIKNIKSALITKGLIFSIQKERGRIYITSKQIDESIIILKKIFGIVSVSPALKIISDIDIISKASVDISRFRLTKDDTFAVRVNRIGNHNYSSKDIASVVGSNIINETHAHVNLKEPDFILFIEIRYEDAYIFTEKISGSGGMPVGTQGRIIVLIDTIYSILSSWFLIKRGCKPLFFIKNKKIENYLNIFCEKWHIKPDFYFHDMNKNIFEEINKLIINKKCGALVTGHFLGDNSIKILSEISEFKQEIIAPVFYPLILMENKKINQKIEEIVKRK